MITGLHHVSITTGNFDRMVDFYCDLLGFTVALEFSWDGDSPTSDAIFALEDTAVRMAMLKTSNAFFEIFEFSNPVGKANEPQRPVCDKGVTHMCLTVGDIDGEYARLLAAGMRFHCPPQMAQGLCRATYGRDPDGNIVELIEPEPDGAFAQRYLLGREALA